MKISVSARLKELGYTLPPVARPLAAYVPSQRFGDFVWTSGQLPTVDGHLRYEGKLGAELTLQDGIEAARICGLNALAAAGDAIGTVDDIVRIVKATVYIAADPSFTDLPKVANGTSELLAMVFGPEGQHVRSAVGVASLPLNAPVEVELIVQAAPLDEDQQQ